MASERQIAANRRNAGKSTGPRSPAGRKRASTNAYRHGLAARFVPNPEFAVAVERLAHEIAGNSDSLIVLAHARSAAEATLELDRVRCIKVALIQRVAALGALHSAHPITDQSHDRGIGRARGLAWTRHPLIENFDLLAARFKQPMQIEPPAPLPAHEPARSAEALRRVLPELCKLERYERRAVSRRDRALRFITMKS
jgi:hypothetical protein